MRSESWMVVWFAPIIVERIAADGGAEADVVEHDTKNDVADAAIAEELAKADELAQSKAGQKALAEAHADAMAAAENGGTVVNLAGYNEAMMRERAAASIANGPNPKMSVKACIL